MEVESIRPTGNRVGMLTVSARSQKVQLVNQLDDFHQFLVWLKAKNPSVKLRGC